MKFVFCFSFTCLAMTVEGGVEKQPCAYQKHMAKFWTPKLEESLQKLFNLLMKRVFNSLF